MSAIDSLVLAASDIQTNVFFLAQGAKEGPMGPEFGKASPIGLLILALMGAAVLFMRLELSPPLLPFPPSHHVCSRPWH